MKPFVLNGQTQFIERLKGRKSERLQMSTANSGVKHYNWSGREDLNLRPLPPEDSALPG